MKYNILLVIKMGEYKISADVWVTASSEEEAEKKFKDANLVFEIMGITEI